MLNILQNKYQQNPELATKLVNTGQRQLHEATSDNKWSTGAELASKTLLNSDWKGQDIMGKLLETVRSDLLVRQTTQSSPPNSPDVNNAHSHDPVTDDITPLPDDDLPTSLPHSNTETNINNITSTPARNPSLRNSPGNSIAEPYLNSGARSKIRTSQSLVTTTDGNYYRTKPIGNIAFSPFSSSKADL